MKFILDPQRKSGLNAINARIAKGKGIILTGEYGTGKTEFLKQLKKTVWLSALSPTYQILGEMAEVASPRAASKATYLKTIKPRTYVIDEAHHLPKAFYPYLKAIIDKGVPVVLAGLPSLLTILQERYPDVLSRLKQLSLKSLEVTYCVPALPDFEEQAVRLLYGYHLGNLRLIEETAEDCLARAQELGQEVVTSLVVEEFL